MVLDTTSDILSVVADNLPTDLSEKILLGATKERSGWKQNIFKVADINVFSTALSEDLMKAVTKAGFCDVMDGDYLSWEDMEWEAHGEIDVEVVD